MWVLVICNLTSDNHNFTPFVHTSHEAEEKEVRKVPIWMSFMFSRVCVCVCVLWPYGQLFHGERSRQALLRNMAYKYYSHQEILKNLDIIHRLLKCQLQVKRQTSQSALGCLYKPKNLCPKLG